MGQTDTDGRVYVTDRRGQRVRVGDEVWWRDHERMYAGTVLIIFPEDDENLVAIGSVRGITFRQPEEIERRPRYA